MCDLTGYWGKNKIENSKESKNSKTNLNSKNSKRVLNSKLIYRQDVGTKSRKSGRCKANECDRNYKPLFNTIWQRAAAEHQPRQAAQAGY